MASSSIRTNRDLYLAVTDLTAAQKSCTRTLEEYLLALWALGRKPAGNGGTPRPPQVETVGLHADVPEGTVRII